MMCPLSRKTAAKAAGMQVWVIPNRVTSGLDFSAADRIFSSLEECAAARPFC